jgi:hypothetical protein
VIGPVANHDDNQHHGFVYSRLRNLWDGIEIYAASLRGWELASIGPVGRWTYGCRPAGERGAGHAFAEAAW